MFMELGCNLDVELEPPVLPVLRVRLDEEPVACWMKLRHELDDHAAHRQEGAS